MNNLVAGSAGFIGSHIVEQLHERADSLTCGPQNFPNGKDFPAVGRENLEHFRQNV